MRKSFWALAAVASLSAGAHAQTATTGAINGTVRDSTGAVVPGADVSLTDTATGSVTRVKSDAAGHYAASLLKPDTYSVTASASGLQSNKFTIAVNVSQQASLDVLVTPSGATSVVEITADAVPLIDTTTPALVTTFSAQQLATLPAPGGDITTVAYTAPGVVVNAGGSYGNFSADGLPATSNLFVFNGFDDQDPFLNLNNSGSSNLTLGQAEVAEASVVLNGYTTQYGRAAGAVINYITKSGGNRLHGQVNYFYNGSVLNANEWFRNNEGAPRERAVSNQFAVNVGGPITIPHIINGKDKLFFFVDYEFLHYVLPSSGTAVFPSPQLQTYILNTIPAQAQSLYQQAFGLYKAAPAYAGAQPVTNGSGPLQDGNNTLGCGINGFAGTPTGVPGQTFGVNVPCATAATGSGSNVNKESLLAARVDWNINDHHKIFFRFKGDRGSQPTYTNFSAPIFNELSIQPGYEGQLNDTVTLTPNLTNQFIFAANWYTAFFGPANITAVAAAFPSYLSIADNGVNSGSFGNLGVPNAFPQGRNVTQYQFVDDLSWIKGKNTFRFGYNFRRNDLSVYDADQNQLGTYTFNALSDFASGNLNNSQYNSNFTQQFNPNGTAHLALYNLGAYLQDDIKLTQSFTLNAGIRFDRTGNPLCNQNCFTGYNGNFPFNGVTNDTPYNRILNNAMPHVFKSVESVVPQPRVGFNYNPGWMSNTVIRGGAGLFADLYPGILVDPEIQNFPNVYSSTVYAGVVGASGAGTLINGAAQQAAAVFSGYKNGQSFNQISSALAAQGVGFTPPNIGGLVPNGTFHQPKYVEYNLQIQHQFGRADSVTINYSGNAGYDLLFFNNKLNASQVGGTLTSGFAGLPVNSPDPNFSEVNAITNLGHSNYNGAFASWRHDGGGLTTQVTYIYSHALDNVTSNPFEPYNGTSITSSLTPNDADVLNYSNGDNDVRHNLTVDAVYFIPYKPANYLLREVVGGWSVGGKAFYRSGVPFSVYNANEASALGSTTGFSTIAAQRIAPITNYNCSGKQYVSGVTNPVACIDAAAFATDAFSYTGAAGQVLQNSFGNVRRNSFYGPHYFDTDLSLYKTFVKKESFSFMLGANAFNAFNHPNFGQPSGNVSSPGSLGQIYNTISPPTSPYGSFQGAVISGRVLQVLGKITF